MKTIIAEVRDAISACIDCSGHPECAFGGKMECENPNCEFSSFCSRTVCRYCHPHGFSGLSSLTIEDEIVSEDEPCARMVYLCPCDNNVFFDLNAVVPDLNSEIVSVVLSLPNPSSEDSVHAFWAPRIDAFRTAALTYIDYVLLKRAYDGVSNIDFLDICKKLNVDYSRESLRNYLEDPRELDILTGASVLEKKNGSGDGGDELPEAPPMPLDDPILPETSAELSSIDVDKLRSLLRIDSSYTSFLEKTLKELRSKYRPGAKGKNRKVFCTKDFIILAEGLFYNDYYDKDKGMNKMDVVHGFLTAMGIAVNEVKCEYQHNPNAKELCKRMVPFFDNLSPKS